MNASSPATSSSTPTYFDLHIKGVGYLNRIRVVSPKNRKGKAFLACTIAALNGPSDAVEYKYYDCIVTGSEAEQLVRRFMQAVNDENRKVLIGFCLGDPWIRPFTYEKGHPKEGTPGFSSKARLLKVSWTKIDGELVHPAHAGDDYDGDSDHEESLAPSPESKAPSRKPSAAGAKASQAPELVA